jgi:hypothetical protein
MASPKFADYGRPIKFYDKSGPIKLKFRDFQLEFSKQLKVFGTLDETGPYSVVDVFELTEPSGKKIELQVVVGAGLRDEGPKFTMNTKTFQLTMEFNGKPLEKDELVILPL